METIRATILKILFFKEASGYKVLVTRPLSGKSLIIVGEFGPEIIPESIADFHGEYKTHPKYGHQFKAQAYNMIHNAEELSSIKLFLDSIAPNIGSERSSAIVDFFKNEVVSVLDNTPERLLEVPGIGDVSYASLSEAWKKNRKRWDSERVVYSLRAFLVTLGLKERRIKKVIGYFGGHELEAEEKIKKNPYQLVHVEGFGFTTVDYIARKLGISEESPERLKAFIIYCLEIICPSQGHLFYTVPEILGTTYSFCQENNTKFLGKQLLPQDINDALIGLTDQVVIDEDKVYSMEQYSFEQSSAFLLYQIMKTDSGIKSLTKAKVEKFITRFEDQEGITLSEEQKSALYYFVEKKVFVITGAPGTGKTKILKAVVQLAHFTKLRLTCMTPTGISAKKLASTIEYEAFTIHRRLGYRGKEWTYNEQNPFDTDVVILDESSMIDQEVLYRMLSALNKRTRIVFVGDHNQLPSVGAGNVLRELINCGVLPVVTLDKIFRQDEASDIIKAAHQIIHGDTSLTLFKEDPKADIFFMREREIQEIEKIVVALAAKFKNEKRLFQIITPRNTGPLGVDSLNQILQQALNPDGVGISEMKLTHFVIRKGDRVLVRKNDYENSIFNGDVGKVIDVVPQSINIKIDDMLVNIPLEEIEEKIKLAYAMTCHKSQGLEYPTVILLMVNQHGKNLLQRNLLYTAITRAKKKVIVIGHGSAVERSINNTSVIKRNTKLGERLCSLQKKNPFSSKPLSEPVSCQDVTQEEEPSLSEIGKYFPMAITGE
jgi:exodeoxyribonuclease V alpha subunit